jgi:hypothetical protein
LFKHWYRSDLKGRERRFSHAKLALESGTKVNRRIACDLEAFFLFDIMFS